ncbi:MAG: hypothetical protein JJT82_01070 [Legionellaceae bacterium]|nr:hypothetical protein [Legionellaceae bacterium]
MFGWVDKITADTAYRGWNLLVATVVVAQYVRNPEAVAAEYLPDVFIHAFEALAPDSCDELSLLANAARLFQAGTSFWSGESSIPAAANFVDVFNHTLNIKHRFNNYFFKAAAPPQEAMETEASLKLD